MSTFTAREKADCAAREVKQRRYVYGRRVAEGTMTQAFADRQIAVMEAIFQDYEKIASEEEAKGRLL